MLDGEGTDVRWVRTSGEDVERSVHTALHRSESEHFPCPAKGREDLEESRKEIIWKTA